MNVTASDIGGGSIHMDTTMQTGKRRDLAPLNVYVRIRPFIGDELERAENQALIDILDDKRIAVKVYPAMSNAIRTLQSSYNEYEVGFLSIESPRDTRRLTDFDMCSGDTNLRPSLFAARIIRTHSR